ncbi:unnamed protein product [Acanthoscelides obtectus]|uniref:Uncharacterized protein n=1 Tax=Acanthoscelides obtectus TaxID=200917 RepID=A0A9P0MHA6_ACAOB|nr:unnamed protein product [Acanthoscelides obtectus]CAK1624682.1 hypothetical protein AOBTE_LOCUS2694 [Acanthoscelides obtectus]
MEILYLKTKGLERTQNMISVPQRLMKNAQFSLHLRPYSFMLEYGSISIIKGWLIRAKERKEVDKTIRDERISYYHSIISKSSNKQKTTWNIVNSIKGKQKNAVITELVCDNVTITNPTDIANFFGKYVSTVIGKKMAKNFTVLSDSCTTGETAKQSMFFTHVTTDDVILICDK